MERILSYGFERVVSDHENKRGRYDLNFNPQNGWMGLVIYHPYECFINANKKVELSLERYGVTDLCINEQGSTKIKVNEKHITISINGGIVYHNKFGIMPPIEIENELINA